MDPYTEKMNRILEATIRLAVSAHAGQMDKGGNPYILHPLHIMDQMDTPDEKCVAVLHDTIEDTSITVETLEANGIPEDIISDVVLLTKKDGQTYEEYIMQIKGSSRATKVKLADMRHNSDLTRMHILEEKHLKMIAKYHWATLVLRN